MQEGRTVIRVYSGYSSSIYSPRTPRLLCCIRPELMLASDGAHKFRPSAETPVLSLLFPCPLCSWSKVQFPQQLQSAVNITFCSWWSGVKLNLLFLSPKLKMSLCALLPSVRGSGWQQHLMWLWDLDPPEGQAQQPTLEWLLFRQRAPWRQKLQTVPLSLVSFVDFPIKAAPWGNGMTANVWFSLGWV